LTYSTQRINETLGLIDHGFSLAEASRRTGVARSTIRSWLKGDLPCKDEQRLCVLCRGKPELLPVGPYGYLLGLYLGDGCISSNNEGVYRLRIQCCNQYPDLIDECQMAMAEVLPNKVGRLLRVGCTEVGSSSKHWPCFFPQHGPGPKHLRHIILASWQQEIVSRFPAPFLRGLIHSDGCRVENRVNGIAYLRYHFSNASGDIRELFAEACDRLGIEWRQNNARNLSVARRKSVTNPRRVRRTEAAALQAEADYLRVT
jgi:hypothetical protein